MISVIVCYVNEKMLRQLETNVAETIGVEYEMLPFDNRMVNRSICSVYNEQARKAKGEILCFIHEDVLLSTNNWGGILETKVKEQGTGIIGFAGSQFIDNTPYWYNQRSLVYHYIQRLKSGAIFHDFTQDNDCQIGFKEVVVLDGMFLCCSKDVWMKNPFDEKTFQGFHLYDIDFSISVAKYLHNYVCMNIQLSHYSLGTLSSSYYDALLLFYKKWKSELPFFINNVSCRYTRHENINRMIFELYKLENDAGKTTFIMNYLIQLGLVSSIKDKIYACYCLLKRRLKTINS